MEGGAPQRLRARGTYRTGHVGGDFIVAGPLPKASVLLRISALRGVRGLLRVCGLSLSTCEEGVWREMTREEDL